MNKDIAQGNWNEIKGKIRAKWGKLTDDDVETLKGNLEQLSSKIQQTYGYAKEKAQTEYEDFKQSLAQKTNKKIDNNLKQ